MTGIADDTISSYCIFYIGSIHYHICFKLIFIRFAYLMFIFKTLNSMVFYQAARVLYAFKTPSDKIKAIQIMEPVSELAIVYVVVMQLLILKVTQNDNHM